VRNISVHRAPPEEELKILKKIIKQKVKKNIKNCVHLFLLLEYYIGSKEF